MILVSDYFVHKVRRSSVDSQRLRPRLAFAAFKAAGNGVILFDLFLSIKQDPSHRRRSGTP